MYLVFSSCVSPLQALSPVAATFQLFMYGLVYLFSIATETAERVREHLNYEGVEFRGVGLFCLLFCVYNQSMFLFASSTRTHSQSEQTRRLMESPTKALREKFSELSINLPSLQEQRQLKLGAWDFEDKENNLIDDTVLHHEDANTSEPQWLKVKKATQRVVSSVNCEASSMSEDEESSNRTWEQMKKEYLEEEQSLPEESVMDDFHCHREVPDYSFEDKKFMDHTFKDFSIPSTLKVSSFQTRYSDSPMAKPRLVRPQLARGDVAEKNTVEIRLMTPVDEGMVFEDGVWVHPHVRPRLQTRYELELSDDDEVDITIDPAQVTNLSRIDLSYSETKRHLISVLNDAIAPGSDWDEVTKVDISGKNIITLKGLGTFLPALKELNLSNNMITTLDGLPCGLQSLSLAGNKITDQVLNFNLLQSLHTLDLSDNGVTNLHQFQSLNNLRKLFLRGNHIQALADLPVVQELDVSSNFIRGAVDISVYNFKDLMQLDISANSITSVTNFSLEQVRVLKLENNANLAKFQVAANCPNLKKLELIGCAKLEAVDLDDKLNGLRLLTVEGSTQITGRLPNLESLTVTGEHALKRLNNPSLVINRHLMELRLLNSGLTMGSLPQVQSLFPHVKFYNLKGNKIDGSFEALVKFFQGYKDLRSLVLDDNPIKENLKDPELVELFHLMVSKLTHKC